MSKLEVGTVPFLNLFLSVVLKKPKTCVKIENFLSKTLVAF